MKNKKSQKKTWKWKRNLYKYKAQKKCIAICKDIKGKSPCCMCVLGRSLTHLH